MMIDNHAHADFPLPGGGAVDHARLGHAVGAAFDGCQTCQHADLGLLAEDAESIAHLVAMSCVMVQSVFGGLPPNLTSETIPSVASAEFRTLVRSGLDGNRTGLHEACAAMTPAQRLVAAHTALDLLVAFMVLAYPEAI